MSAGVWVFATCWPLSLCALGVKEDEVKGPVVLSSETIQNQEGDLWGLLCEKLDLPISSTGFVVWSEFDLNHDTVSLPVSVSSLQADRIIQVRLSHINNQKGRVALSRQIFPVSGEDRVLHQVTWTTRDTLLSFAQKLGCPFRRLRFLPEAHGLTMLFKKSLKPDQILRLPGAKGWIHGIVLDAGVFILGVSEHDTLSEIEIEESLGHVMAISGKYTPWSHSDISGNPDYSVLGTSKMNPDIFLHEPLKGIPFLPAKALDSFSKIKPRMLLALLLTLALPAAAWFTLLSYERELSNRVAQRSTIPSEIARNQKVAQPKRSDYSRLLEAATALEGDSLRITYRQIEPQRVSVQGRAETLDHFLSFAQAIERKKLCQKLIIQNIEENPTDSWVNFEILCLYEGGDLS